MKRKQTDVRAGVYDRSWPKIGACVPFPEEFACHQVIPFIAAAIAIRPFLSTMQRFRKHLATVEKLLGGFLVLTGVLFLTNSMTLIASWMLELFPGLATIG